METDKDIILYKAHNLKPPKKVNKSLSFVTKIHQDAELLEFFRNSIHDKSDIETIKMFLDSLDKIELLYNTNNTNKANKSPLTKDDKVALLEYAFKNQDIRKQIVDSYLQGKRKCLHALPRSEKE